MNIFITSKKSSHANGWLTFYVNYKLFLDLDMKYSHEKTKHWEISHLLITIYTCT